MLSFGMRAVVPTAAVALALLGSASASEIADPFPIRDPFPLRVLFLDQAPGGASTEPPGAALITFGASYVNTMVATDRLVHLLAADASYHGNVTLPVLQSVAASEPSATAFVVDSESLRAVVSARCGLARRFEITADVPFLMQGPGFLDSTIDDFHRHFSLPDGGRPAFAQNRYRVGYIGDGAAVYFDGGQDTVRLGDVVLSATGALLVERKGGPPGLSLTVAAKFPTGDFRALAGSGSFDYGGMLRFSKTFGRSTLHTGYSYNQIGTWRLAPTVPLRDTRSSYIGYAFSPRPDFAVVIQGLRTAGPFPFRTGSDLGKVAMEVMFGFRARLSPTAAFEWSFIENLDPYYNTPDVGAFLGMRFAVGRTDAAATARSTAPSP